MKKEKFAFEEIYSLAKKPNPATEILGEIIGCAGIIIFLGGISPMSMIISEDIRSEALITGGILITSSIILLHTKSYNHKKWIFEVINN